MTCTCLSRPTQSKLYTLLTKALLKQPPCNANAKSMPDPIRSLSHYISLCVILSALLWLDSSLWAFSSQLLTVQTKTRMNIDRGSWLRIQSAALKVNEKNQSKWKSTKKKKKIGKERIPKSLQRGNNTKFCNNFTNYHKIKYCAKSASNIKTKLK